MSDSTVLISVNAIQGLGLGFGLGAIGQGARAIVGFKKTHDEASAKGQTFSQNFSASELLVSLFIGGITGAFAMIPLLAVSIDFTRQSMMMLLAAGYAGTDVIEGLITKSLPTFDPKAWAAAAPVPVVAPVAAPGAAPAAAPGATPAAAPGAPPAAGPGAAPAAVPAAAPVAAPVAGTIAPPAAK